MAAKSDTPDKPIRLPKRKKQPFVKVTLLALAASSGGMLMMAVPNLISGTGIVAFSKAALLAASATAVAYGINRMAVERGAPLATIGYVSAGIVSVGSILVVGGGLFAGTYAGLTFKDVAELQLQEYGTELSHYVGNRSRAAQQAGRVAPAVRAVAQDLDQKRACELRSSCVSGRGNGGRGPVARALEDKAGRASAIVHQLDAGEKARRDALAELNRLLGAYQDVIGDSGREIWDRRTALQKIDAEIQQAATELDEAVPVALITAYGKELQLGTEIAGRPVVTRRLNAILDKHGQSLKAVASTVKRSSNEPPSFPRRTGVSDTFRYLGHFAPIAAITAVAELVFPLALWLYTLLALLWARYKIAPPEPAAPAEDDDSALFDDGLIRNRDDGDNVTPLAPPRRRSRSRRDNQHRR
ncbi:hypothetical protein GGD81_004188 [Rhodobium orientis]|uniref:Uncharacterized protein n=1 Tax=Rhodobium orientis TaxID=34017 RepID=A0A327JQ67_9HYPH|nr:hypothetical protein [Rhodobium orientis]MBB4305120.1 hypothetical protein [Rhodobium orientis]MBK5950895.1 hypothetical protein [Rhodobium orientis]RAI27012.1 hypothetical protein CH339_11760 [Rhodobium orientis]